MELNLLESTARCRLNLLIHDNSEVLEVAVCKWPVIS